MRWNAQALGTEQDDALPGLARLNNLVRTVETPEFAGITFHEVLAKSALNRVPSQSKMNFGWTINPYRGCSHACAYCLSPDTSITMADGSGRRLDAVEVGDFVVGTRAEGRYRRYVEAKVLAKWATKKPAYRILLADGTELVASGDHRFLTERGWKYVVGAASGPGTRPHLTLNNSLLGFGAGRPRSAVLSTESDDYRRGYLAGMIRGDGMIFHGEYPDRKGRGGHRVHRFRLALADLPALERSEAYLASFGIETSRRPYSSSGVRPMEAIHTAREAAVSQIEQLIDWPAEAGADWSAGFLGGIFDAEGSHSRGILRISNKDTEVLSRTSAALSLFGVPNLIEPQRDSGVAAVRVRGGLPARRRMLEIARPAVARKCGLLGEAVKSAADLRVVAIEPLGERIEMLDITTTTGDFVANGVISHNCFARPTHEYLELDAGEDFDRQIIVKVNVAEVLRKELARPSWRGESVALGTNTDPYQRAEGRYALMPGIIDALVGSGTPFSVLTKGTLLRRDLPRLAEAAEHVPVDLAMSIAVYDDELQQAVEPGTPSTKARLATVTAVREAGLDCAVFLMPILPYLTDTTAHLDEALRQVKAAGATSVLYTALHLRGAVKPWFMQWLERDHPELVPRYRSMYYGNNAYAPKAYRRWLGERIRPLIRRHGLERGIEDPVTGGIRSRALGRAEAGGIDAASLAAGSIGPSDTLF